MNALFFRIGRLALPVVLWLKALRAPVAFGVAAIVEDGNGRVVLVRHTYRPGWHLPGGGVERGERPTVAILRELKEEIGLLRSDAPSLQDVFSRKIGIVTNVVALYRVTNAELAFKPNFEIREIVFADPANPPPETVAGARQRLAELVRNATPNGRW